MNDNIKLLQQSLEEARKRDAEAAAATFGEQPELTDEEKARLEEMKGVPALFMEDTDEEGRTTQISAKEYAKPLDDGQVVLKELDGMKETLKVINSGDIEESIDKAREDARTKALQAFKQLALGPNAGITDNEYMDINNGAIKALEDYFKSQGIDQGLRKDGRLDVDKAIHYLSKCPMSKICTIFPRPFLEVYLTAAELKTPTPKAKERLLTSIAYLLTTGPEMNYLNEYIDHEERLMVVSKRMAQCQVDFSEMLKDERAMSDMLLESRKISPADDSFWSKHISDPKKLHSKFAHNVVIYRLYRDGYTKILDDYPESDPDNAEPREIILKEIDECNRKIEVYSSICDMTLARELWVNLVDRYSTDKRVSMDFLTKEAISAVEAARRCKQNLPFPGFRGEKRAEQIFSNYVLAFRGMVTTYNARLEESEKDTETDLPKNGIGPVRIEGYNQDEVQTIYALLMVILMGRIIRKCTRTNVTKADVIVLDAYFQIFCDMGSDVYMMQELWDMMKDFVKVVLDKFYLPGASAARAKEAKKAANRAQSTKVIPMSRPASPDMKMFNAASPFKQGKKHKK
ncbi:hypothetical protein [uncultured Duncaniella sp.]|uniref:hypothetical protein n=1 Tax=uncultured Duncaniella sp. TaxID=2768039 RepID=UPI00262B0D7E|nr:hypothetical protein [uncultured Duncaniella sp.]